MLRAEVETMWSRLFAGGTCVLAVVAAACASNQAQRQAPEYTRSPAHDYSDPPRSASDGQVIGAHQQSSDDWILVLPTNEHTAAGWEKRYGRFQFRRELTRGGRGAQIEPPACDPPLSSPLRPDGEVKARAELYRAWVEAQEGPRYVAVTSTAAAELAAAQPHLLDCNR
jgi:hypothetical protein